MRSSIISTLSPIVLLASLVACSDPAGVKSDPASSGPGIGVAGIQDGYEVTPAGVLPRSCVYEIEDGAHVDLDMRVKRTDGTSYRLPKCQYSGTARRSATGVSPTLSYSYTCKPYIECAFINKSTPTGYSKITATWSVPTEPLALYTSYSQKYYEFPGLASGVDIIQPVLQYALWTGGVPRWSISSWRCGSSYCPHSRPILVNAGDVLTGSVVASNCAHATCTWTITTTDVTLGTQTILIADGATQDYGYAYGGAVETYYLSNCNQYPANGVAFSGVSVSDYDYSSGPITPSWLHEILPGLTYSCNFNVSFTPTSVTLAHNPQFFWAIGELTATAGCTGYGCNDPQITSITASGNSITVRDNFGHTGTITLKNFSASGGLTATGQGGCGLYPCTPAAIVSATASGRTITLKDNYNHAGYIFLSTVTAIGGFTAYGSCILSSCPSQFISVRGASNGIRLVDSQGHSGTIQFIGPI